MIVVKAQDTTERRSVPLLAEGIADDEESVSIYRILITSALRPAAKRRLEGLFRTLPYLYSFG
jgi:hypothetical protein